MIHRAQNELTLRFYCDCALYDVLESRSDEKRRTRLGSGCTHAYYEGGECIATVQTGQEGRVEQLSIDSTLTGDRDLRRALASVSSIDHK